MISSASMSLTLTNAQHVCKDLSQFFGGSSWLFFFPPPNDQLIPLFQWQQNLNVQNLTVNVFLVQNTQDLNSFMAELEGNSIPLLH